MLDFFLNLDKELLLAINGWNNPFFDVWMFLISDRFIWVPFYIALLYTLYRTRKPEFTLYAVIFIVLLITAADQFASGFCKPFFERLRPTHDPSLQGLVHVVNGHVSSLYGFISSHAANTCALAMFLSLLIRYLPFQIMVFSWAVLNCYSRMYMGVHFPADIFFGAIAGLLIGLVFYEVYVWVTHTRDADACVMTPTQHHYMVQGTVVSAIVYGLLLVGISIFAGVTAY